MNDEFLHRIRNPPPPHFLYSLKTRLDRLEREAHERPAVRRSRLLIGSLIAGVAFATGLYTAVSMYDSTSNAPRTDSAVNSLLTEIPRRNAVPQAVPMTLAKSGINSKPTADEPSRTTSPFTVGATVFFQPIVKEATRFFDRHMYANPPFGEPTSSLLSRDTVFPSLCDRKRSVEAVVVDRRILPAELDVCRGVGKHIAEIKLGYEAIALVRSSLYEPPRLSSRSLFLALAREIPDPLHPEQFISNPNTTWDQIDSALPSERIDVLGPPTTSGFGLALRDLILKTGCLTLPTIAALEAADPSRFEEICGSVRTDGIYRVDEATRSSRSNPFDLLGYLQANPTAIALLAYREENLRDGNLAAGSIDGVTPNLSIIYAGSYPGARTLYLYANTAVPHMRDFVFSLWSSIDRSLDDMATSPTIPLDPVEKRNLLRQAVSLPDLKF